MTRGEKYKAILLQEKAWAMKVAESAMRPKPITVWEVLIPVLILFNHLRLKAAREVFAENILFTKKMALEAAMDMVEQGLSKEEALGGVKEKTQELLSTVKDGLYSEEIREAQLQEVDLLIDHYLKLLQAEGKDYASLITNAYGNKQRFEDFLGKLREAEKRVNNAATLTLGVRAQKDTLSRIELAYETLRSKLAGEIFS